MDFVKKVKQFYSNIGFEIQLEDIVEDQGDVQMTVNNRYLLGWDAVEHVFFLMRIIMIPQTRFEPGYIDYEEIADTGSMKNILLQLTECLALDAWRSMLDIELMNDEGA